MLCNGPNSWRADGKFIKQMKLYDVIHVGVSSALHVAWSKTSNIVRNSLMCQSTSSTCALVMVWYISQDTIAFNAAISAWTFTTSPPCCPFTFGGPLGHYMYSFTWEQSSSAFFYIQSLNCKPSMIMNFCPLVHWSVQSLKCRVTCNVINRGIKPIH